MHQLVENGRLRIIVEMYVLIMYHFTMESFEIIQELKQNIVIEVKRFIRNLLLKYKKCGIVNNQLSYCEQNIIRDNCHSGGYLCSMYK